MSNYAATRYSQVFATEKRFWRSLGGILLLGGIALGALTAAAIALAGGV